MRFYFLVIKFTLFKNSCEYIRKAGLFLGDKGILKCSVKMRSKNSSVYPPFLPFAG